MSSVDCLRTIPFGHRIVYSVSALAHSVTARYLQSGNDTIRSPHHLFGQHITVTEWAPAMTEQMMRRPNGIVA